MKESCQLLHQSKHTKNAQIPPNYFQKRQQTQKRPQEPCLPNIEHIDFQQVGYDSSQMTMLFIIFWFLNISRLGRYVVTGIGIKLIYPELNFSWILGKSNQKILSFCLVTEISSDSMQGGRESLIRWQRYEYSKAFPSPSMASKRMCEFPSSIQPWSLQFLLLSGYPRFPLTNPLFGSPLQEPRVVIIF